MNREKFLIGNWKMNKDKEGALALLRNMSNFYKEYESQEASDVNIVICPPFPYLSEVTQFEEFGIGAQNCHYEEWGAFTGEVSVPMLKSLGCHYIITGHSERRQYFGENALTISKKIDKILEYGLTPIFCCGENFEVRNRSNHLQFIKDQIRESLFHLEGYKLKKIIIAYEPIWAIGTNKTPSSLQIQEMHHAIREFINLNYDENISKMISIIYGGSLNEMNCKEILSNSDVDGGLVGGASLNPEGFINILKGFAILK